MFQEIELPDGSIAEFPADMSDAEISAVLRKQFSAPQLETGTIAPGTAASMFFPEETMQTNLPEGFVADMPASIAGGVRGAAMGSRFGGIGALLGGAAGGIAGGVAGKETEEALGIKEDATLMQNLGQSAKEEAFGQLMRPAFAIGAGTYKGIANLAAPYIDLLPTAKKTDAMASSLIKEQDVIPSSTSDRTILDAEKELLGDAENNIVGNAQLTPFEMTGGKMGAQQFSKLSEAVQGARAIADADSEFLKNRDRIYNIISSKVGKSELGDPALLNQGIRSSFTNLGDLYQKKFAGIDKEIFLLGKDLPVDVTGLREKLAGQKEFFESKAGADATKKIYAKIENLIPQAGQVPYAKLKQLQVEVDSILPNFQPSANVQKKIAGQYGSIIEPFIKEYKDKVKEIATPEAARLLELESTYKQLAQEKSSIVNSKIGKAFGLTEEAQRMKPTKDVRIDNEVFASPEAWEQTIDILQKLKQDKMIPLLQERLKNKVYETAFSTSTGNITFDGLQKAIKQYGGFPTLRKVAGDDYARTVSNSLMLTKALETSKGLADAQAGVPMGKDLWRDIQNAAGIRPLAQNVGTINLVQGAAKKLFGLKNVSDKAVMKAFTGEKGRELMMKAMNTPFDSPEAYTVFVQIAREANKAAEGDKAGSGTMAGVGTAAIMTRDAFASAAERLGNFLTPQTSE